MLSPALWSLWFCSGMSYQPQTEVHCVLFRLSFYIHHCCLFVFSSCSEWCQMPDSWQSTAAFLLLWTVRSSCNEWKHHSWFAFWVFAMCHNSTQRADCPTAPVSSLLTVPLMQRLIYDGSGAVVSELLGYTTSCICALYWLLTTFIQAEISQPLLDGCLWTLLLMWMMPRGWILTTLGIHWLLLQRDQLVRVFYWPWDFHTV